MVSSKSKLANIEIGTLVIDPPIFLAPMSSITNVPFRLLCKSFGVGMMYTEFTHAQCVLRNNEKTQERMKFLDLERPIGIQIYGSTTSELASSAEFVAKHFSPDVLDINFGCPVPKVTKIKAGSAILRNLKKLESITNAVVNAIDIPVTVKMRAGFDLESIVAVEAAQIVENSGVKALTIHPRTTKQMYKGSANWEIIAQIKKAVQIPVIGNGDLKKPEDIFRMFKQTDCDGVMIGRAAIRSPWIFSALQKLNNGKSWKEPTIKEKFGFIQVHIAAAIEYFGDYRGGRAVKPHVAHYLKGFPGAARFRKEISKLKLASEISTFFHKISDLTIEL